MLGRTNAGGAGGGLNFKVVGGTTQPTSPKENMIWINTNQKITSYIFSAIEPENLVEGMVWISIGASSDVAFSATKKNPIMVYPLSAFQYVGGVLVAKDAMSYQGGKWTYWGLPSIYQEVAYLKSSGSQAIDTGYIQNENTEFLIDLNYTFAQWDWPMGVVSGENYFGIQLGYQNNSFSFFFGRQNNKYGGTVTGGVRHKIEYKNGAFYIDNAKMGDYAMVQVSTKHSVFLFAESTEGTVSGNTGMHLYRFTISEKGKVLHDFVPCYRKEDSVAGMFDLIGRTFHTNVGTGTFVVGGDV